MVNDIIDYQKTVVCFGVGSDCYRCVLGIVAFQVLLHYLVNGWSEDCCRNSGCTFLELPEDSIIYIVVYYHNALPSTSYKVADQCIRIEDLSIKKDALPWRQRCPDKEIHSVAQFFYLVIMF